MPRKILRLPIVLDRTGLSRSTVYQRVTEGKFPHGRCRSAPGPSAGSKQRWRSGLPAKLRSAGKSATRELA